LLHASDFQACCPDERIGVLRPNPSGVRFAMSEKVYNVLFLCTGNSARSILAEALTNHWGKGLFKGYSAGSQPKGEVHPLSVKLLGQAGLKTDGLTSKSWEVFSEPDAPQMDYVFTVCDQAAGESCPIWPGHPITAHWGLPDPAAAEGTEAQRMLAFRETFRQLERRIQLFVALRHKEMSRLEAERKVAEIGRQRPDDVEGQAS
jgi:arsenate reductase